MNFLYYVLLKSTHLDIECIVMHVTLCIGHLKYIGLLSYVDLPNVDTFHYTMRRNLLTPALILFEKFVSRRCQVHSVGYGFSKI